MTSTEPKHPKVFINYSHDSLEHKNRVLNLSNRLRADGIDCHIDQYEESPPEGWPRWMRKQVKEADFVLVVCTEKYERRFEGEEEAGKGLGTKWEGAIITQGLYDAEANNTKFIPVLFSSQDSAHIPVVLRGATYYKLDTENGYEDLYRRLTNQPRVLKPELGKLRPMPPLKPKERRVQQAKGAPREETVLEKAHRIERKKDRESFLHSLKGVQSADVEFARLLDELEGLSDGISAGSKEFAFKKERNERDFRLLSLTHGFSLYVAWYLPYPNTLRDSCLYVQLRKDFFLPLSGVADRILSGEEKLLREVKYGFDRDIFGDLGWRQSNGAKRFLRSAQLAQECIEILLDEVWNMKLGG